MMGLEPSMNSPPLMDNYPIADIKGLGRTWSWNQDPSTARDRHEAYLHRETLHEEPIQKSLTSTSIDL